VLEEADISTIDALKIDIEGGEHLALAPFLNTAPQMLLPRLVIIEDRQWPVDLYGMLERRGYVKHVDAGQNLIFQKP
jgi:Methyltransferase FkbM domain